MRFLVLGGTGWLSGLVAAQAVSAGHEVTCLARGRSGRAPQGARLIEADRTTRHAYDEVASATWDVLVDVSSQPGQERRVLPALRADILDGVERYGEAKVASEQHVVDRTGFWPWRFALCLRPLAETLADTLDWELSRPPGQLRRAGLSDDDERALIEALCYEPAAR